MKTPHASLGKSSELLPHTHAKPFPTFRKLTLILISIALLMSLSISPTVFRVESRIQSSQSDTLKGTVQAETEDVSGMHRVIFTTERGNKVFVNLPDDIADGDTVSGTVFAVGAGKTDADQAASLLELNNQTIDIVGQKVPATGGRFELNMRQVIDPSGGRCDYWVRWGPHRKGWPCRSLPPSIPNGFLVAPQGQVGRLTEINGSFDGKFAADDYVKVGDQKMMLLAESPRKTVFLNNSSVVGPTEVEIREQGQVQKRPFRNLKLSMSAQKYELRRGEQTTLKVVVEGLSDLREPLPLQLKNHTPNIMTLGGGDVQNITIRRGEVKQGGVYQTERTLTGIQIGAFLIQGSVIIDGPTMSSGNNTDPGFNQPRTRSPYRVGEEILTVFESSHPYGSGISPPREQVTSFTIHHAGATYIAPHFSAFSLEPRDYVVVRSPNGNRSWRYVTDGKLGLGRSPNGFWGVHVPGDTAIVELHRSSRGRTYGFKIDRYARGYTPEEALQIPSNKNQNTQSICVPDDSRNAQCYQSALPAVYDRGRPVARLLINGVSGCTGWLFGSEGHVITNQHCITNAADAQNVDIEFNAEGGCNDNCSAALSCPGTVEANASTLVKNSLTFDYALLKPTLTTFINLPNKYGYLRARTNGASVDEKIFIPQHPAKKGKRIAVDSTDPHDQSGYAEVAQNSPLDIGYYADTEGGSSGSPVLALNDNFVVGLHHLGGCPNHAVQISAVITDLALTLNLPKCARATDINCPPSSPSQRDVPECNACTNDFQCVLPATCVSGACVIAPFARSVDEQCCTDGQCQSGRCGKKKVCECAADSDCPAGQFCKSKKGGNVCKASGTKDDCEGCFFNFECKSRECTRFRCTTPGSKGLGEVCCRDRQCTTRRCKADICECRVDSDCGAGSYCEHNPVLGINSCFPLKGPCDACSATRQCGPGLQCQGAPFGKCISGGASISIGGSCCKDVQCASGSCSSAGACQCRKDSDCGADQFCHLGFLGIGKNSCRPQCSRDSDCGADQFCDKGSLGIGKNGCRAKLSCNKLCSRDAQCQSGTCGDVSHTCRKC